MNGIQTMIIIQVGCEAFYVDSVILTYLDTNDLKNIQK